MTRIRIPVYFYALAAMVFWGMSFIWTTILLQSYRPVTIILIRLILSASFLFSLLLASGKLERIQRKDLPALLLSALFNPFLYFLGENYGLKFSTPTLAAVIIATIPLFSPIVAWLTFRERLGWVNIAGILLAFGGILVMLLGRHFTFAADPKGVLFLFGAVVSALFYTVFLKRLTFRYSPMNLIAWQNLIGIILFLPVFLAVDLRHFLAVAPDLKIISSFLFLAILCSSLSFVFFAKSVKELGISKANIFSNLIPVFTAIFSFFMLSESFTLLKIAGMLIVIAGVFLSEWNRRRSRYLSTPASGS
ncbi:MAG TPA: DMT family transporter [Bacteroidales bacterium]|nr:DMT family transporter [Bacteroidales bacterium]